MRHVIEGRVTPTDRARDPYLELPFTVGAGVAAIEVRYRHDAGSVLDLGLFDPTVAPFPSRSGFRGWSGGAREHVMLTPTRATPGYLPGPIVPGTWYVLLGLAAVASNGCAYRVEVTLHQHAPATVPGLDEPPAPSAHAAAAARVAGAATAAGGDGTTTAARDAAAATAAGGDGAAATSPRWYRADLQSHSHHSDARGSLLDLRAAALARGLEVLAVTDHNTVSHHAPLAALASPALLWLPGMEVTTYRGHANVWGVEGWVDFRIRSEADVETLVEHVQARGGLFSVNHPKTSPGCIGCDWEYGVPAGIDCLEAWQGPWWLRNWESLERYDQLLREGRRVTLVGGSDRHQPAGPDTDPPDLRLGSPTTWLWLAERSEAAVLAALRAGRTSLSEGPTGPFLTIEHEASGGVAAGNGAAGTVAAGNGERHRDDRVRARVRGAAGEQLRWIGAHGVLREVAVETDAFDDAWTPGDVGPFLRAEVVAAASLQARREAFARAAAGRALPFGLDAAMPFERPYRLALSAPLYFD